MADVYQKAGYDGLVITDHFFNGNTAVPRELPWRERVSRFTEGYRKAAARGKEIGLQVFFGWEFSLMGTDFLTYGLDADWLNAHEDCDRMEINAYADLVHESGGWLVQAHPFREASYIDMIRLLPRKVDAVETVNACRTDFENRMADRYADAYGLAKCCGTDNHVGVRERFAALTLETKAESISEILTAVTQRRCGIRLYTVSAYGSLSGLLDPAAL